MASAFSKSTRVQIFLSIPLLLFGIVAVYLIHRANSGSAQVASRYIPPACGGDIGGGIQYREDEPESRKAGKPEDQKAGFPALQISGSPDFRLSRSADLAKRLGNLKYDGYMRIGDVKLAWISHGKSRIAVKEGGALDDTIRIDEIHENFLRVSAANGHIVQKIPFTRSPDEQVRTRRAVPLPSSAAITVRNTGSESANVTSARSMSTSASQSKGGRWSDRASPPSSRYGPPPIPGEISPAYEDDQVSDKIGTVIHIDPALKAVKSVGETFTVQVKINNGSNIFAVPFDVRYDPGILEVAGLYEGSYLKKGGGQTTFFTSTDRDKGKITIGLTRLGRIGGVSGSGTLMSIAFRALKSGTTFLSFANERPMDSKLNVLPVRFLRGRVEVE